MRKAIMVSGVLLAGLGLSILKAPHFQLASQLRSGGIDGRRIPLLDFMPERFEGRATPLQCGTLHFQVPAEAEVEPVSADEPLAVRVRLKDLACQIMLPRNDAEEDELEAFALGPRLAEDEVGRRVAICAASEADLSFWMSTEEVERLQRKLQIRPAFCMGAERIEVVHGQTLSGLLMTWRVEGMPRMVFTYFSPDNRISGTAFFFLESDSAEPMRLVRALVSTFRLDDASRVWSPSLASRE